MAKDTFIRINPQDMSRLKKSMAKLEKLDKGGLSSEVGAWAMHTAKDASALAPKKTSKLSQSYFPERDGNTARVFNTKLYAPFIEFGTGAFVDLSELSKLGIPTSYASQFRGQGIKQVNIPAKPHLFPSASKNFDILFKNIQKRILNIWKK
tara:strand:+ start:835 stop:1287 length:453 start_codon:yes stop_codon:yes gene_type:complete